MSGIVAAFSREGQVRSGRFDRALESLAYRGHDGSDRWVEDGVALGHQHFWTTPEEVGERQPVRVGDATVAFAGRLDDRAALSAALPVGAALAETTDAELFGHAYEEWGPACLDRAVGAFGVALWDHRRERLVCARDKTGIRHLFVAVTEEAVVVASDVGAVRAYASVPDAVADPSLAAFLQTSPGTVDGSFHEGVDRLPAGSRLIADDSVRTERYWHPTDGPSLGSAGRAELRSRLREAVREATRDRLRCRERPALFMSGGLDSTTVGGVAAEVEAPTAPPAPFSMVFEAVEDERLTQGERQRIHDLARRHDLPLTEVVVDDARPFDDPEAFADALSEGPCLEPLTWAIDRAQEQAADVGHQVALTGHGGNLFNGSQFAYADLLRNGKFLTLLRHARRSPMPTRQLLVWYAAAPTFPGLAKRFADVDEGPPEWLGPALRGIEVTPEREGSFDGVHWRRNYREMTGVGREFKLHATRRQALRHGLDLRMPYLDARVVELGYAIPPYELLSAGERNGLFREAFGDLLPESVRAIRKGQHFDAFVSACVRDGSDYLRELFADSRLESRGYVADGAATDQLDAVLEDGGNLVLLWRLFASEQWLRRF